MCSDSNPTADQPTRWHRHGRLLVLFLLGVGVWLYPGRVRGQQILQEGFEARGPRWRLAGSDASPKVLVHALTEDTRHSGQRSEHIRLQAEKGSFIHYTYTIPKAPITDDLNLSIWLKSNRPGVQLLCRFVFPRERDAKNPAEPLTVLVRCEPYQYTRWKLLSLAQPVKRLREQQRLLTHQLNREIVTTGAYVDQLVLNGYDGPGLTDIWVDDLEVGPVENLRSMPLEDTPRVIAPAMPTARRASEVLLRGNQLLVGNRPFFLRGIRYSGLPPLSTLREAGFNTVFVDETSPPEVRDAAARLGFWMIPSITPRTTPGRVEPLAANEDFVRRVNQYLTGDAVLAWDLGSHLTAERFPDAARLARAFRQADPQRPVIADVWDGFRGYSTNLEQTMIGTHRWPLFSTLELEAYRDWLEMRRRLCQGTYCWTWVQTHMPEWFVPLMKSQLGSDTLEGLDRIGPHPEQIRLLAYTSLAAGYSGLAFWSDRYLSDAHQGKDRLLSLALLNQELSMIEPIILTSSPPEWIGTNRPEVKAAVFRSPKGTLVLPIWVGYGSQIVPGQSAASTLTVKVPGLPITASAWEISPGRLRAYRSTNDIGGTSITIENFGLTAAILFTSDLSENGLIVPLQNEQRKVSRLAAQWLHDQAKEELAKVEAVQIQLEEVAPTIPDARPLLEKAKAALEKCMAYRRNGEHGDAYGQAEVCLRALRVLMRAHWDKAVSELDSPVSTPFALTFHTLPAHWKMANEIRRMAKGASMLEGGDFEKPPHLPDTQWRAEAVPFLDKVDWQVIRTTEAARRGAQSVKMRVSPIERGREPAALERTCITLSSPEVQLQPGTLVRITAWIKIPAGLRGSPDGLMFFDSIGGPALAARVTGTGEKWKRIMLYRRVPSSGKVRAVFAMTGMGTAYIDDVTITPLGGTGEVIQAGGIVPVSVKPGSAIRPVSGTSRPTRPNR